MDNMELSTEVADQPFILATLKPGSDDVMELPQEADGTVLLSTVQAQFPSAVGLKFKSSTGGWRGIRAENNVLAAPNGGWATRTYVVTESDALKRKPTNDHADGERSRGDRGERGGDRDDRGGRGGRGGDRRGGGGYGNDRRAEEPRRRSRNEKLLDDLIVLGLPYGITQEKLQEYFTTACGEVSFCQVKLDKGTGKSRGFGFIRFKEVEAAEKAMKESHEIDGRKLVIRLSQKEGDTPTKLFVGSLPPDTTEDDVKKYFQEFGDLVDMFCPNPFRGFAFITFSDEADARKVLEGEHTIKGRRIQVNAAESKTKREQQREQHEQSHGDDQWNNNSNYNNQWGHQQQQQQYGYNEQSYGNDSYYSNNAAGYSAASSYGSAPGAAARGYDDNNTGNYGNGGNYDNKKPWQRNKNESGSRMLPPRGGANNYNNNNRGGYQSGGGYGAYGGAPQGVPPVAPAAGVPAAAAGANAEVLNQVKDMLLSFMTGGAART